MVQEIQLDSKGAMFGRGFGQGLADQLPKEIERGRLSAGLKSIGENKGNLNPYQQASELINLPGMTPEKLAILQPLLERQNANRDAKTLAASGQNGQGQQPQQQPVSNPGNPQQTHNKATAQPQNEEHGLITRGPQQAALNPIPPLTTEERRSRGAELHTQYPSKFPTTTAGEEEAVRERQSQIDQQNNLINQGTAQSALRKELEAEVDKRLNYDLQKEGQEKFIDVPGNYIKKKIDDEDKLVASGKKTTLQAAEDASKDINSYAKVRQANKTEGKKWMLSKKPTETRSLIDSQRKAYAERAELDTFVDDLITNHDLSRARAEAIAYPLNSNKSLKGWIDNQPKKSFLQSIANTTKDQDKGRKLAKELPKYLGLNDSLGSVIVGLSDKNIDPGTFIDQVRKMHDNNEISLSKHNADLLNKLGTTTPTIGDWFLYTLGDYGSLPEEL